MKPSDEILKYLILISVSMTSYVIEGNNTSFSTVFQLS